jgi:phosphoesterase RecJ-like protein
MLMMKNIKLAALITEQPTIVKISLRSKGDLSVQEIARKHFKGGGHRNAAGGQAFAKLEDVVTRFKAVLPQYIHN